MAISPTSARRLPDISIFALSIGACGGAIVAAAVRAYSIHNKTRAASNRLPEQLVS